MTCENPLYEKLNKKIKIYNISQRTSADIQYYFNDLRQVQTAFKLTKKSVNTVMSAGVVVYDRTKLMGEWKFQIDVARFLNFCG